MTKITTEKMQARAEAHRQAQGKNAPEGKAYIPDRYITKNEQGEDEHRSHSEDALNEILRTLNEHGSAGIVDSFKGIQEIEPGAIFKGFKEEAAKVIENVNNLRGDAYTQEGRDNAKAERLQKLAAEKIEEVTTVENASKKKKTELNQQIEKELNSYHEDLTNEEVSKIALRNNELTGMVKTLLYKFNDTRNIEWEYKELVKQAEDDETLARFLSNNSYLFLDKINQLDTSEADKQRATHTLLGEADKLTVSISSPKTKAMNRLKKQLENKNYHLYDKRLIKKELQNILKK